MRLSRNYPKLAQATPLIFLPATDPADRHYGQPPTTIAGQPVEVLDFGRLVWYNRDIRAQAAAMIRACTRQPAVLVGFSKSGNGALNLAIDYPELVAALIIFDAPLTRHDLPPWDTAAFYDQATWSTDLPLNRLDELAELLASRPLIHIAGQNFQAEHRQFAQALEDRKLAQIFIDSPDRAHHWDSGWLAEGLAALASLRHPG